MWDTNWNLDRCQTKGLSKWLKGFNQTCASLLENRDVTAKSANRSASFTAN